MNYWFTSDHHFFHDNIRIYCGRPFSSSEEMTDVLIQRWNEVIKWNDKVFYLGDFTLSNEETARNLFSMLNGKISFIEGNHDSRWIKKVKTYSSALASKNSTVAFLPMIYMESINSNKIIMSHYSMRSWPDSNHGSWHLYGHHHGRLQPYGKSFDVGVDCNAFYPFSFEEVEQKMETLQQTEY